MLGFGLINSINISSLFYEGREADVHDAVTGKDPGPEELDRKLTMAK